MKARYQLQASLIAMCTVAAATGTAAAAQDDASGAAPGEDAAVTIGPVLADADAAGAEPDAQDASAGEEDRPITPMGGTIDPFGQPIDPFYGNIDPFKGNIDPFGQPIDPFGGNINPFYGDIQALWGTIDPFGGQIDPFGGQIDPFKGQIAPFYGQIDPFKGNIDPFSGVELPSYIAVNAFWNDFGAGWETLNYQLNDVQAGRTTENFDAARDNFWDLMAKVEQTWAKATRGRTGKNARQAVVDPLLVKFGMVGGNRMSALLNMTRGQRAQFVVELYDQLMTYTGNDHVDHWMKAINWTPQVTRDQGNGADAVIGILDGAISNDADLEGKIFSAGGYAATVGGHGTSVASLMVAGHDGKGVFGIAPNASVATYNPFDETGTASWADVKRGIMSLTGAGASIINMSLGISGWTLHRGWGNILAQDSVRAVTENTVFVVAAGNDGSTQRHDVRWRENDKIALIVVGSVDPLGNISSFSNRPGSACLVKEYGEDCKTDFIKGLGPLANRFIVAPGELLLVSDGQGGLTRRTGTSFAAPLVSGAITLLHDRWPWLGNYSAETAEIILRSATDLGAPGVDEVYGHGLLNVAASQSPLDFNALKFRSKSHDRNHYEERDHSAAQVLSGGVASNWEADGVFMVAYEKIGRTKRDFKIPLSQRLFGQRSRDDDDGEYFQSFVTKRFKRWIERKGEDRDGDDREDRDDFTDVSSFASVKTDAWNFGFTATDPRIASGLDNGSGIVSAPTHTAFQLTSPNQKFGMNIGYGEGAMALVKQSGFGLTSDYASAQGGVNPLLGMASGGAFMDASYKVGPKTTLSLGFTDRVLDHSENMELTAAERARLTRAADYEASAVNLGLNHKVSNAFELNLSLASIVEDEGLLGTQSTVAEDLSGGTRSTTLTLGTAIDLPAGFAVAASGTVGRSASRDASQALRTDGAVTSSAWAVSVSKAGVVSSQDRLRLSVNQAMHIESGRLAFDSVEVVDRATGETGLVTHDFSIADDKRRIAAELLYAAPVSFEGLKQDGEFSLFGRASTGEERFGGVNQFVAGAMISLDF